MPKPDLAALKAEIHSTLGWDRERRLVDIDSLETYELLVALEDSLDCTLPDTLVVHSESWDDLFENLDRHLSN